MYKIIVILSLFTSLLTYEEIQIPADAYTMIPIEVYSVTTIEWYDAGVLGKGSKSVHVPGTHSEDIRGYPRDKQPDAGCYEYNSPSCNEDLQRRIFPYIGNTNPDENYRGDMDWDGDVDYQDYWILGSWWVNYDENLNIDTILPYPTNI